MVPTSPTLYRLMITQLLLSVLLAGQTDGQATLVWPDQLDHTDSKLSDSGSKIRPDASHGFLATRRDRQKGCNCTAKTQAWPPDRLV